MPINIVNSGLHAGSFSLLKALGPMAAEKAGKATNHSNVVRLPSAAGSAVSNNLLDNSEVSPQNVLENVLGLSGPSTPTPGNS